eukprot:13885238-Alexandrium_andersonii.AAC.1
MPRPPGGGEGSASDAGGAEGRLWRHRAEGRRSPGGPLGGRGQLQEGADTSAAGEGETATPSTRPGR